MPGGRRHPGPEPVRGCRGRGRTPLRRRGSAHPWPALQERCRAAIARALAHAPAKHGAARGARLRVPRDRMVAPVAEVAAELAAELPPSIGPLVSFPSGDAGALRERLTGLLGLGAADRARVRATVRRVAAERWSWAGIARRLLELSE